MERFFLHGVWVSADGGLHLTGLGVEAKIVDESAAKLEVIEGGYAGVHVVPCGQGAEPSMLVRQSEQVTVVLLPGSLGSVVEIYPPQVRYGSMAAARLTFSGMGGKSAADAYEFAHVVQLAAQLATEMDEAAGLI